MTSPLHSVAAALDTCAPRSPFPHPYDPYPIQHSLMSHMYTTIRRKGVGIFESPTGTVSEGRPERKAARLSLRLTRARAPLMRRARR